jgi:hypothetical protein
MKGVSIEYPMHYGATPSQIITDIEYVLKLIEVTVKQLIMDMG